MASIKNPRGNGMCSASGIQQTFRYSGISAAVVDGETGFLVEEHHVRGTADAMDNLLSDSELRKTMGTESRKRAVEHFSSQKLLDQLRNVMGIHHQMDK